MAIKDDSITDALLRLEFTLSRFANSLINDEGKKTLQKISAMILGVLNQYDQEFYELTKKERKKVEQDLTDNITAILTAFWLAAKKDLFHQ